MQEKITIAIAAPCHTRASGASPLPRRRARGLRAVLMAIPLAWGLSLPPAAGPPAAGAFAATCSADDFARAVDEAGASLRAFNMENAPKLNARLRQLRQKKGWAEGDDEEMAHDYLSDARLAGFDATANELLARIDTLGRPAKSDAPDCVKLDELRAAGLELIAVMKAKSAYTLAKIDGELAGTTTPAKPAAQSEAKQADARAGEAKKQDLKPASEKPGSEPAKPADGKPADGKPAAAPDKAAVSGDRPADKPSVVAAVPAKPEPPKAEPTKPEPPKLAPAAPRPPVGPWSTTTAPHAEAGPPPAPTPSASGPQIAIATPPDPPPPPAPSSEHAAVPPEEGYTIEEIRDATKGFFGAVSTNLATVIEHTFSSLGRPTGYVLGTEGGGAFLAGLRYGSGMLYLRSGGARPVHWHGPSVGYDFGAAGSRTLFLIYGLKDASQLFRAYTGIDGSAYVIGGVGVTFLKGGPVMMAPIRSGLGLRVGANIGYVRFTSEPSWNPF